MSTSEWPPQPEFPGLARLAELGQAATPAPWVADTATRGDCVLFGPDGHFVANAQSEPHWVPLPDGRQREAMFDVDRRDTEFMAAARNHWDELLTYAAAGLSATETVDVVMAAMDCVSEILVRWPDAETNNWLEPSTRALVAAVRRYSAPAPAAKAPLVIDGGEPDGCAWGAPPEFWGSYEPGGETAPH